MTNPDLSRADWRRSKYSGSNGNCVEVGADGPTILVRDTKNHGGMPLTFHTGAWAGFLASIK
jgi:hypothetical protein